MEPNQQQQRHTAAKDFQESLDQLQQMLEDNQTQQEQTPELNIGSATNVEVEEDFTAIDLAAFEDAVADIEQYLETKRVSSEE
ncbi:MAG: hypothetical protein HEQ35_03835 [Gloeotrichia echinulata IR180]|jgi:hypothetical protein|nr:hypothetical protein [Gloeotrichia echinulata DEX184]